MVSKILGPNQARQNVGPDLDPNCLQRLSADDTSKQRGKQEYRKYCPQSSSEQYVAMNSGRIL